MVLLAGVLHTIDAELGYCCPSSVLCGLPTHMLHALLCRHWGRKRTMLLAGILFDIGVVLTAGAINIYMLMAGRVLLGVAVAFASVSVTLYNSEMAPAQLRGRLNQLFQVEPLPCLAMPQAAEASTAQSAGTCADICADAFLAAHPTRR